MTAYVQASILPSTLTPAQVEGVISRRLMLHVGWGGSSRTVEAPFELGLGVLNRGRPLTPGIRLAVWEAAYGYVNGFRKRDIAYYVLTRSLSKRVSQWAIRRESARSAYTVHTHSSGVSVEKETGA